MATIVQHRNRGDLYVLVGAGFGQWRTSRSYGSGLFAHEDKGEGKDAEMIAVCDGEGDIHWVRARSFVVLSIDGVAPGELVSST